MSIKLAADAPIFKIFGDFQDPRRSRNQLYPLIDILSVVLIGILCTGTNWISIVRWTKYNEIWFKSVGSCLNGLPSHDTLGRFFQLVDPKAFEVYFRAWTQEIAAKIRGVIAIDGKTIHNSGDPFSGIKPQHLVSAFAAENESS